MNSIRCFSLNRRSLLLAWRLVRQALISFPTRRSSDLRTGDRLGATLPLLEEGEVVAVMGYTSTIDDALLERFRSEEHTSELQSPMYLVCRLLLEQKKSILPMTKSQQ